jgi:outer membrane protein OmpA-like peptidoglycan-associated protein
LIVYFKNGRADVSPDYVAQLQEFAEKAKGVNGYKVQIQGYASAVGARAFNEALSEKRAGAVTAVLQRGGVPPANIFVPAAMGISEQFAENNTAGGQAANRRVIVTILQSKGLVDR